jgi:hypothetical protein
VDEASDNVRAGWHEGAPKRPPRSPRTWWARCDLRRPRTTRSGPSGELAGAHITRSIARSAFQLDRDLSARREQEFWATGPYGQDAPISSGVMIRVEHNRSRASPRPCLTKPRASAVTNKSRLSRACASSAIASRS